MASELQRFKQLRQVLADATAELKVQEKRKKQLKEELKELGVSKISDIPKIIGIHRKKEKTLKNKLDKCLDRLENEFSDLDT